MKQAIILCSGGLDSVVCAHYVSKKMNYKQKVILFFDYSQKSLSQEERCARICAREINATFVKIRLPELKKLSTSLITEQGTITKLKKKDLKQTTQESKKWYVPARNTLFISYALALAESTYLTKKIISDIYVGFKSEESESYPDTTKTFISHFNTLSKTTFNKPFAIKTPLRNKEKEDIVALGNRLNIDFKQTMSCYIGKKNHCGYCLNCKLRQQAFYWADTMDPTVYSKKTD